MTHDHAPKADATTRLLGYYYLATPLFFAADYFAGFDARAAFIEQDALRYGYYAMLMGLSVLAWRLPIVTAPLGILESAVNLLLHVGGMYLALARLPDRALEQDFTPPLADLGDLFGFLLVGGILIVSLRGHLALIRR